MAGHPPDGRAPARRTPGFYPFSAEVETRFQDLDPLGHINNVAMSALFEQGRVRFNHDMLRELEARGKDERWLIARVDVNYLAEAHFPAPLIVHTGVGRIGTSSWTLLAAGFQHGADGALQCVATCDCVMVMTGAAGPVPIPEAMRQRLETRLCPGLLAPDPLTAHD